jgi:hypothetical protein
MTASGKKSGELIPGVDADALLGIAAIAFAGYVLVKRPDIARMVAGLFTPAPPAPRPPVELPEVRAMLEGLAKPLPRLPPQPRGKRGPRRQRDPLR